MKHMRTLMTALTVVISLFAASCGNEGTDTLSNVRVSASAGGTTTGRTIATARAPEGWRIPEEDLSWSLRGLVDWDAPMYGAEMVLSPDQFILDIDHIVLYQAEDPYDPHMGAREQITIFRPEAEDNGCYIPQRVNLLAGKNFSKSPIPSLIDRQVWDSLFLRFLPHSGVSNGGMGGYPEGFWPGSIVGIRKERLGGLEPSDFDNAVQSGDWSGDDEWLDKDHIWFVIQNLVPYDTTFLSYICLQGGCTETKFIRPGDGPEAETWGPVSIAGNGACILGPMEETIDTNEYLIPEINISYDTEDLIYIYKNVNSGKYLATLNPGNPFPIDVEIGEYSTDIMLPEDRKITDRNEAVPFQCIKYRRDGHWTLSWVHPTADGMQGFRIYESEEPVFDNARLAATVNVGTVWQRPTEDMEKPMYFWITTEFEDGTESRPAECRRRWTKDGSSL